MSVPPSSSKASIADLPQTGDAIAPDLMTLMERMERARKFLRVEQEYIRLVLVGGMFILFGTILTPDFPWRMFFVLALILTPILFGWFNMPLLRLNNTFKNETLPFLLREYGRWNYALHGTHFPREPFRRTGLLDPTDQTGVANIITGERFGIPMQLATISSWPKTKYRIYRGKKANFEGWVGSIRLNTPPEGSAVILPHPLKPQGEAAQQEWTVTPLSTTHQIFSAKNNEPHFTQNFLNSINNIIHTHPQARFAFTDKTLWVMVPADHPYFLVGRSFHVALNEPTLYEKARVDLAGMFATVDQFVWPHT